MSDLDSASTLVRRTEEEIEKLKSRVEQLQGKEHKKERSSLNKKIYNLENDDEYVSATKIIMQKQRDAAKAQDDQKLRDKLKLEEETRKAMQDKAEKAREALATAESAPAQEEQSYLEVEVKKKGNGTKPTRGDNVKVTYTGSFAPGTEHGGVDYSGKVFDSTFDAKRKEHKPLAFQVGSGRVIRGWDEAILNMSLGESVVATIGPKWGYRKSGVQNEESGGWIVPPNATLVFQMELVGIGKLVA